MSRHRGAIFGRILEFWRNQFGNSLSFRERQERNDLYKIALALEYNHTRLEAAVQNSSTNCNKRMRFPKKDLEIMFNIASKSLEEEKRLHDLPTRNLRLHIQNMIAPQLLNILKACRDADDLFPEVSNDFSEHTTCERIKVTSFCTKILLEEYESTVALIDEKKNESSIYLKRKADAMKVILSSHDVVHSRALKDLTDEDAFGCRNFNDEEINRSLRYHQMINITKSSLIRQKLGYAPLVLKSTISGAGRGVFVDGFAPAGTITSFHPGFVWPKEYLTDMDAFSSVFNHDPKQQLSIRYDDILIDSRKSPYTVLNNYNSNMFAVGHIVNHPSKTDGVGNCSSLSVDFTEKLELGKAGLGKYIPNVYWKRPMTYGPKVLDIDEIQMQGLGLVAFRDIENEEIFYDYRLSPSKDSYPEWYHVCNKDELKSRWAKD